MTPNRPRHERAFVIQFQPLPAGAFVGTVEHVASGRAERFRTPDELTAILAAALAALDRQPPPQAD